MQAGKIAQLTEAKNIVLGHYSVRYDDRNAFRTEAQQEFEHVLLAQDLRRFTVDSDQIDFQDLRFLKSETDSI